MTVILGKKHGRLRKRIIACLEEKGEAATGEILDFVNERLRYGATMNQLGNILAKDPRIEKVGKREMMIRGIRIRQQIWRMSLTEHGKFERTC